MPPPPSHAELEPALYLRRSMLVLLTLGFAGGVPLEMAMNIMPTWAAAAGWSTIEVGWLALARLPYSLKVLWAPLTDHAGIPGLQWLGRRRAWLLVSQVACLLAMFALAWNMDGRPGSLDPNGIFLLLGVLVMAGATQDIVGDAYRAEILQPREFGAGASVFVTGARLASVLGGAGALIVAGRMGADQALKPWAWATAIGLLALSTLLGVCGTMIGREPDRPEGMAHGFGGSLVQPFRILVEGWGLRLAALFLFVLLYRLPDNLTSAMNASLLVQGLGYDTEQIGWVKQFLGFTLSIVGAMLGGWLLARWGLTRCLWIFGVLQAASNVGFLALAQAFEATVSTRATTQAPIGALIPVIAIESLCGGMVACGFVACMMSVCDRRATATQYALLTSVMAIGHTLSGWLSGWMVHSLDYAPFYAWSVAAAVPGMALIPLLASRIRRHASPSPPESTDTGRRPNP
jgi:PAT family beta-lactamase induction signal transducer AmpG